MATPKGLSAHDSVTGRGAPPWLVPVAVAVLVVLALVLRVWILASPLGEADADEAVVGLMAEDMLDGDFEAFFWGQEYGGVHEAAFVALLLAVGLPSLVALKAVPLVLFTLAAVLVWRIGRRLVDGPAGETAGRLAGAIFFAAPAGVVWMATKERGFYGATLVLGLAAVLLVLRLDERRSARDAALLGLAAGSAFYASPQAAYLLLPAGGWLLARAVRRGEGRALLACVPLAAAGALVGAAPWLWANVASGFQSLEIPSDIPETSYAGRLELFFRRGLPVALGLRNPVVPDWIGGAAGQAAFALLLAGAVALVAWRRPQPGKGWLVVASVAAYPFVFAVFPTSFTVNDARYVTLLAPLLALAAGWALVRSRPAVLAAALGGVAALTLAGTAATVDQGGTPGLWDASPGDLDPMVAALDEAGVDRVYADYWIANRLAFESGERIVAASLDFVRHPPYEQAVGADAAPAYVLFRGTPQERWLGEHLARTATPFDRLDAGIFVAYLPAGRVAPGEVADSWARARDRD